MAARNWYTVFGKRFFDIVAAGTLIVLLSPLLLTTAFFVRRRLGTPVYFHQDRPGLHGRIFRLQKFRTMTDAIGPNGELLSDELRLTSFGQWLRTTSLDELPELWNILRGEMSFVGPRPLLVRYLPRYNATQARRHEMRPGLTGWAQINGRNATTWEDRLERDVWYVDHCSFWLDAKILLLTVKKVLWRTGISAAGEATMSEFQGSVASAPMASADRRAA